MSGLFTWLAAWAITVIALGWQQRLLKATPALGMRTTLRTSKRLLGLALLLDTLVLFLASAMYSPLTAGLVTLAAALLFTAAATVVVDLHLMRAVVRRIDAGDSAGATRLARFTARVLTRHGPAPVVARGTQTLAMMLAATGDLGTAEALLARLERRPFPLDTVAWGLALDLAAYRVALGRCAEAKATIRACATRWTPSTDKIRGQLELIEARIEAATGAPEKALERASARDGEEWDYVRAHAHAAAGRPQEARQLLERIRLSENGAEKLRKVVERRGPAADLARELLEEKAAPYR